MFKSKVSKLIMAAISSQLIIGLSGSTAHGALAVTAVDQDSGDVAVIGGSCSAFLDVPNCNTPAGCLYGPVAQSTNELVPGKGVIVISANNIRTANLKAALHSRVANLQSPQSILKEYDDANKPGAAVIDLKDQAYGTRLISILTIDGQFAVSTGVDQSLFTFQRSKSYLKDQIPMGFTQDTVSNNNIVQSMKGAVRKNPSEAMIDRLMNAIVAGTGKGKRLKGDYRCLAKEITDPANPTQKIKNPVSSDQAFLKVMDSQGNLKVFVHYRCPNLGNAKCKDAIKQLKPLYEQCKAENRLASCFDESVNP